MTSIKTILKNILSNYIKVPTVFGSIIGVYEPPFFTHLFYVFFLFEKTQNQGRAAVPYVRKIQALPKLG